MQQFKVLQRRASDQTRGAVETSSGLNPINAT